jgi:hypothetical protein
MSNKKLNAIKEIESRIFNMKKICDEVIRGAKEIDLFSEIDKIDDLLFDIDDFINDLKETNEAN